MLIQMPMLSVDEVLMLESSQNEDEWRTATNRIKLGREGLLPPDWQYKVIHSGLYLRVQKRISQGKFPVAPMFETTFTHAELR